MTPAGENDAEPTTVLRAAIRARRFSLHVVADDTVVAYAGAKRKRRVLGLAAADAAALRVSDDSLVEMLERNPAPLRAWVRVGDEAAGKSGWTGLRGRCWV